MLKLLKKIFLGKKTQENVTKETKKCLYCLKRVPVDTYNCPYCRKSDFRYDEEY